MKTCFIVNPRSGRASRALDRVRSFAARRGMEVVLTERPRHARDLAARALADGCELVVAVGGDGTMNEVATALVGTNGTLGLVPCGSGDGLGRFLRIHGSIAHALAILESGRPRLIDTGIADGHAFFNVAGLGFEARLADRFNGLRRRGFLRYLSTGVRTLRDSPPLCCTVCTGENRQQLRAFTLVVANSDQYGNNACIAPGALIDDGLLDLCAVPPLTAFNALPLALRLFSRRLDGARGIIRDRAERFLVERETPGPIQTDGEIHQAGTSVEFAVRPASLRIMCPAA